MSHNFSGGGGVQLLECLEGVLHLNVTWCYHEGVDFALRENDTMFETSIGTQSDRLRLLWL